MIHFCSQCGAPTGFQTPAGDSRPRHICCRCNHIHYENPRLVVGCIAEFDGKILLCRRAIEPRRNYWTLPGGFMENSETTSQGALRETLEEAGTTVVIDAPFAMVNLAFINQVHLFYRGHLQTPYYAAGEESLEVRLVALADIPWDDLAFRSVAVCLEQYITDRQRGEFGFHESDLPPINPLEHSG